MPGQAQTSFDLTMCKLPFIRLNYRFIRHASNTIRRSISRVRSSRTNFVQTLWLSAIAACFLLPIIALAWFTFAEPAKVYTATGIKNIWQHLLNTTLPSYIWNSFALVCLTASYAFILGVTNAWIVSHYQFPTRRWLNWALALPFAIPTYIAAYIYAEFLDYSGPLQIFIRELIGTDNPDDYYFPAVRSLGGAGVIMALSLYPYVYLFARKAFYEHSASLARAQALMGIGGLRGFFKLSLPMARPALAVGVILVILETLNDFGSVQHLAVNTVSLGVYNLWLNLNDLGSAVRLASFTIMVVCSLIFLEQFSRAAQEQYQREGASYAPPLKTPRPAVRWLFTCYCWAPIIFGFIVPVAVLVFYSIRNVPSFIEHNFFRTTANSLMLALGAAAISILIGISVAYFERSRKHLFARGLTQLINMGYAIPGTILAIGIMIPFGAFDNWLDLQSETLFGIRSGLLLIGTGSAIVFAYVVRFTSIALGAMRSSLKKIPINIDYSARLLGYSDSQLITRIHLPILKKSILTSFLIVFIDSLKELSSTIILRPFDFETLATHIYAFASDELIEEAAAACLLMVLACLIPILLVTRSFAQPVHK